MNKFCNGCKTEHPEEQFGRNKTQKDGRQSRCRRCMSLAYKKSRAKKKEHYKEVTLARQRKNTEKFREWKSTQGCKFCGETFGPCLQLHHLNEHEKEACVSELARNSLKRMFEEAKKCIVVCGNCHVKIHHGIILI